MLRGADTARVRQFGHRAVSTYGIGGDLDAKQWRGVFRQLVAAGLLEADIEGHGALRLTHEATPVLRGERSLQLRAEPPKRERQRKRTDTEKRAPAAPIELPEDAVARFTALRRFALEACTSACGSAGATWQRFYTSPTAAFPAVRPRPVAPNLLLRTFDVPDTPATAIRFVALENQCTGYAGYAGEQDDDPTNATDCKTASDRGQSVRAAELQVY